MTGVAALFALLLVSGWRLIMAPESSNASLVAIDWQLQADFPRVPSFDRDDVARRLNDRRPPVLLDVRTPEEFAVSHLPGAIRVNPGAGEKEVLAAIGPSTKGRDIVLYCSVGVRSTHLANDVREKLLKHGFNRVGNLSGGIFAWHNQGRRLVGTDGKPTDFVHPYDDEWARFVDRQDRISFLPKAATR